MQGAAEGGPTAVGAGGLGHARPGHRPRPGGAGDHPPGGQGALSLPRTPCLDLVAFISLLLGSCHAPFVSASRLQRLRARPGARGEDVQGLDEICWSGRAWAGLWQGIDVRVLMLWIHLQVVGDETLAQLQRRVTACGFYSGQVRMESMFGRLGLENANARVWDQMTMDDAPMQLSFAPRRLDLADVDATITRTRRARPCCNPRVFIADSPSAAFAAVGVSACGIDPEAIRLLWRRVSKSDCLGFSGMLAGHCELFLPGPDTAAISAHIELGAPNAGDAGAL